MKPTTLGDTARRTLFVPVSRQQCATEHQVGHGSRKCVRRADVDGDPSVPDLIVGYGNQEYRSKQDSGGFERVERWWLS